MAMDKEWVRPWFEDGLQNAVLEMVHATLASYGERLRERIDRFLEVNVEPGDRDKQRKNLIEVFVPYSEIGSALYEPVAFMIRHLEAAQDSDGIGLRLGPERADTMYETDEHGEIVLSAHALAARCRWAAGYVEALERTAAEKDGGGELQAAALRCLAQLGPEDKALLVEVRSAGGYVGPEKTAEVEALYRRVVPGSWATINQLRGLFGFPPIDTGEE
jgi:hypothetical protein